MGCNGMTAFRIVVTDGREPTVVECDTQMEAVALAKAFAKGAKAEIYADDRIVAVVEPHAPPKNSNPAG